MSRDLRTQQLRLDEQTLVEKERVIAQLDGETQALQEHIDLLTRELALRYEYRQVLAQQVPDLRVRVHAQRSVLCPFQNCPADVLSMIFIELSNMIFPSRGELGLIGFDEERARIPFDLSSVCRTWRAAALHTHRIWDYAGVPNLDMDVNRTLRAVSRLETVIARSGAVLIDVVVGRISRAYPLIVDILYLQMHRWRTCEIWWDGDPSHVLDLIRGNTPALVQLGIIFTEGARPEFWTPDSRDILLNSHRLRLIHLEHCPFALDSPNAGYQNLQDLYLTVDPNTPSPAFWATFSNLSSLVSLTIGIEDANSVGSPGNPISLPSLQRLDLCDDAAVFLTLYPRGFHMPALRRLSLGVRWLRVQDRNLSEYYEIFRDISDWPRIDELVITDARLLHVDGRFMAASPNLQNITTLKFNRCASHKNFWHAIFQENKLAKLSNLHIGSEHFSRSSLVELFRCVRARNSSSTNNVYGRLTLHMDCFCGLGPRDIAELKSIGGSLTELKF